MRKPPNAFVIAAMLCVAALAPFSTASAAGEAEPSLSDMPDQPPIMSEVTLEQAVARSLMMNASLAAEESAVNAALSRVEQAGLLPNPELGLEAENFGGGGNFDGFDAAESTVVISQPILLGGKRSRGRAVAESVHGLAGRDLETLRLDLIASSSSAFVRVLAAQEREETAKELLALAERSLSTVKARVDAGKVSPVDATRAGIEAAQARVRLARSGRDLEAARFALAAHWGSSAPGFERAVGDLPTPMDPPDLKTLLGRLAFTPEVGRLEEEIERRRRVAELERSFRMPDLVISVGPRRYEENGQTAWVAGLSLPIPLFDRNQGTVKAAEFEVERARRVSEAVRLKLEADLAITVERLCAAGLEATMIGREVVPAAQSAFEATEIGYREGKFGFLSVLEAQRALFEARSLLLDSREEYALTRIELERLIGGRLPLAQDQAGGENPVQGSPQ